jgi:hypothetical protein
MPTSIIASALGGISIGLLYAYLFKKQTKSLFEGLMTKPTGGSKIRTILNHILFLMSRFVVIIGLVVALKFTGLVDLQMCCIFVVCGFLISLFIHTKRML